jgi:hypothetical protein
MNSNHEEFDSRDVGYEYRQYAATPVDELMRRLAEEARDGWELVCVTVEEPYYRAFLKRRAGEEDRR